MCVSLTAASWNVGDTSGNSLKAFDYICHGYGSDTPAQVINLLNVSGELLDILIANFPPNRIRYVEQPNHRYSVILVRNELDLHYHKIIEFPGCAHKALCVDVAYEKKEFRIFSLDLVGMRPTYREQEWRVIQAHQLPNVLPLLCGNFNLPGLDIREQWNMRKRFKEIGIRNICTHSAPACIAIPLRASGGGSVSIPSANSWTEKMILTVFELN